jgi:hypothetical protein
VVPDAAFGPGPEGPDQVEEHDLALLMSRR